MEDAAIVDLYWQRSDRAISETEKKYGRYCHSIAFHICGSGEDAEECVNDTYLRAWNRMPEERPNMLGTFLGRITRNLALDRIKASKAAKRGGGQTLLALEELEECVPGHSNPETELEQKELEAVIGHFVAALPKTEKLIFIWHRSTKSPRSCTSARVKSKACCSAAEESCGHVWKRRV